MNTFERGSEWRRWDLHVHTKGTNKNDKFTSSDFNSFCICLFQKALEKNIQAIGITDYFEIHYFYKVRRFVRDIDLCDKFDDDEKESIKNIFILPNIELRILPATNQGSLINIHCIFNPDSDFLKSLENIFFGSLEDSDGNKMNKSGLISLGKSSKKKLNDDEAYKEGVKVFHLDISSLIKLFKANPNLKENTMIVVSNGKDGVSSLRQHYDLFENEMGSLSAVRRNIYRLSDAIFSGNPKDCSFFLGEKKNCGKKTVINDCGSLKPCIHGSDAHCEDKLFNPDNDRFCWIKADLSFEGLKQILCEPKDRVKIQLDKPEEKTGYHVIESIEINNSICNQKILFNPSLNTIVGGRSTGKSTLLQLIASRINLNVLGIKPYVKDLPQDSIDITWQDGEKNKSRNIEFFPQNYMHEIARDQKKKNEIIQEIVENKGSASHIEAYEKFCIKNKRTLQVDIDDLFQLQTNIDKLHVILKEKGDKVGLDKEIEALQMKLKACHQDVNFTKRDLHEFEKLNKEILSLENKKQAYEGDHREIRSFQNDSFIDPNFVNKFEQLSEYHSGKVKTKFSSIKDQVIKEWKSHLNDQLHEIAKIIKGIEKELTTIKTQPTFKDGTKYLETNKQYKDFSDRLSIERRKVKEVVLLQEKTNKLEEQKNELFTKIIKNHIAYREKTNELVKQFSLKYDDIEIKLEKVCCDGECKELLSHFINLKSHYRQDFVNNWEDRYKKDIEPTLKTFLRDMLERNIELKSNKDIQDLAKGVLTKNWFSISYEITYQNDTFEKMSDGKKAFVILKLLLEFSNKECPILIDQPEDSLDNRAIYNELVTYFKQKKKERQIILVTHNANIVVNADAEEIIVANQHGEDAKNQDGIQFQYISGSIENTTSNNSKNNFILNSQGIRGHICEILEGGTEAFKKRENKYAIS